MAGLIQRLRRAVATVPSARDWGEAVVALLLLALTVAPMQIATGLLAPGARPLRETAIVALVAFFIPALGEELLFRAPIPDRHEAPRAARAVAISTVAFMAWHALETLWLPQAAPVFLRPEFLASAGLVGLACATMRRRSGSIWTAVVVHWAVVVAWRGWLGGPDLVRLG